MATRIFLDDLRPCPSGWTLARTVEEVKHHLETGVVMDLSLDHDLGACDACIAANVHVGTMQTAETTFFMTCPHHPTGTDLVLWMADTDRWSVNIPTVHSMNPVGAARMRGIIARYWHPPPEPRRY